MVKCDYYEPWCKQTTMGSVDTGVCNAVKGQPECICHGDKENCTYYPPVKESDLKVWKSELLRDLFSYSAREHVEVPLWVVRTIIDFKG